MSATGDINSQRYISTAEDIIICNFIYILYIYIEL